MPGWAQIAPVLQMWLSVVLVCLCCSLPGSCGGTLSTAPQPPPSPVAPLQLCKFGLQVALPPTYSPQAGGTNNTAPNAWNASTNMPPQPPAPAAAQRQIAYATLRGHDPEVSTAAAAGVPGLANASATSSGNCTFQVLTLNSSCLASDGRQFLLPPCTIVEGNGLRLNLDMAQNRWVVPAGGRLVLHDVVLQHAFLEEEVNSPSWVFGFPQFITLMPGALLTMRDVIVAAQRMAFADLLDAQELLPPSSTVTTDNHTRVHVADWIVPPQLQLQLQNVTYFSNLPSDVLNPSTFTTFVQTGADIIAALDLQQDVYSDIVLVLRNNITVLSQELPPSITYLISSSVTFISSPNTINILDLTLLMNAFRFTGGLLKFKSLILANLAPSNGMSALTAPGETALNLVWPMWAFNMDRTTGNYPIEIEECTLLVRQSELDFMTYWGLLFNLPPFDISSQVDWLRRDFKACQVSVPEAGSLYATSLLSAGVNVSASRMVTSFDGVDEMSFTAPELGAAVVAPYIVAAQDATSFVAALQAAQIDRVRKHVVYPLADITLSSAAMPGSAVSINRSVDIMGQVDVLPQINLSSDVALFILQAEARVTLTEVTLAELALGPSVAQMLMMSSKVGNGGRSRRLLKGVLRSATTQKEPNAATAVEGGVKCGAASSTSSVPATTECWDAGGTSHRRLTAAPEATELSPFAAYHSLTFPLWAFHFDRTSTSLYLNDLSLIIPAQEVWWLILQANGRQYFFLQPTSSGQASVEFREFTSIDNNTVCVAQFAGVGLKAVRVCLRAGTSLLGWQEPTNFHTFSTHDHPAIDEPWQLVLLIALPILALCVVIATTTTVIITSRHARQRKRAAAAAEAEAQGKAVALQLSYRPPEIRSCGGGAVDADGGGSSSNGGSSSSGGSGSCSDPGHLHEARAMTDARPTSETAPGVAVPADGDDAVLEHSMLAMPPVHMSSIGSSSGRTLEPTGLGLVAAAAAAWALKGSGRYRSPSALAAPRAMSRNAQAHAGAAGHDACEGAIPAGGGGSDRDSSMLRVTAALEASHSDSIHSSLRDDRNSNGRRGVSDERGSCSRDHGVQAGCSTGSDSRGSSDDDGSGAGRERGGDALTRIVGQLTHEIHSHRAQAAQRGMAPSSNGGPDLIMLEGLLGEGTFGRVYAASWRGSSVAVKSMVLPATMSGAERRQKMAIMETAISTSLNHPNVVQTFTYVVQPVKSGADLAASGTRNDALGTNVVSATYGSVHSTPSDLDALHSWEVWLVLELCDRGSMRKALDNGSLTSNYVPLATAPESSESRTSSQRSHRSMQPPFSTVLFTAMDIARAMVHLHSEHILHGDLKASNILLKSGAGEGGGDMRGFTAKVADFGLSTRMDPSATHMSNIFQGTLTHMAPEALVHGKVSTASDVYAYGILLYELQSGKRAFQGIPRALLGHEITRLGRRPTFSADCPVAYKQLAMRCWDTEPSNRPTFKEALLTLMGMQHAMIAHQQGMGSVQFGAGPA